MSDPGNRISTAFLPEWIIREISDKIVGQRFVIPLRSKQARLTVKNDFWDSAVSKTDDR